MAFERVYVINLRRRPERLSEFLTGLPADWPFAPPERFEAVDGETVLPPAWWSQGGGAWGCYRSHAAILERILADRIDSALILEDDAEFCDGFRFKVQEFLRQAPPDWEMLYLGGQHLSTECNPPEKVNEWVYRPFNVNRTHAFAVRGTSFIRTLYQHLHQWDDWKADHHVDHHLGELHQQRRHKIYAPREWLIGQRAGRSDVCSGNLKQRYWPSAQQSHKRSLERSPFVAVIGLHSSGSSALAGVLFHLGLHLGNALGGFYGENPNADCGFEAKGLARICEEAIPFPSIRVRCDPEEIVTRLRRWTDSLRREAYQKSVWAAAKYPMLCRLGQELSAAIGDNLRIIHIDRPLEESIASLIRRCPDYNSQRLTSHQRWLWDGKQQFIATHAANTLSITYDELLATPRCAIERICDFLAISPPEEKIQRATSHIDPLRRHFGLPSTAGVESGERISA